MMLKMAKQILKVLWYDHHKIFKARLVILQHYAFSVLMINQLINQSRNKSMNREMNKEL